MIFPLLSWTNALLLSGVLSVWVFARSMDGSGPHLFWRQTHHAYYGWALIMLGAIMQNNIILVIGNALAWEDATQHHTQCYGYSFIHTAYAAVYRFPLVRRVNQWLDRRFKRRGAP